MLLQNTVLCTFRQAMPVFSVGSLATVSIKKKKKKREDKKESVPMEESSVR